ncbi:MAG: PAS domain S-box protein [Spirochaetota bacterium]
MHVRPRRPVKTALIFAGISTAWIVVSDRVVDAALSGVLDTTLAQTLKGILFVMVTTFVVYRLTLRTVRTSAERNQLYEEVFENGPSVMLVVRPETAKIVDVNDAARSFYGRSRESLRGMHVGEISSLPPEQLRERLRHVQATGHGQFRSHHRHANGKEREVSVKSGLVTFAGETLVHLIVNDVSEQVANTRRLRSLNRALKMLNRISESILRSADRHQMLEHACRIAVEDGGFVMTWIGLLDEDGRQIVPSAVAGLDEGYVEAIRASTGDDDTGSGPTGLAVKSAQAVVCNDIREDPYMDPWRQAALERGYEASAAFPLFLGDKVAGALNLYAPETGFFQEDELEVLEELAADVSFALEYHEQLAATRRTEEALYRERELLKRMMLSSPVGMVLVGSDGAVTFANGQAESVLGLSSDKLADRTYNDPEWNIAAADGSPFAESDLPFARIMQGEPAVRNVVHAIEWPNGKRVVLRVNGAALYGESGEVEGMVCAIEEITESHRLERELRDSEERFRRAIEAAPFPTIILADDGAVLTVNRAWREASGYSADELTTIEDWAERAQSSRQSDIVGRIKSLFEYTERVHEGEFGITCKDGSTRLWDFTSTPLGRLPDGRRAVITIAIDLTEQRDLEHQLRHAQKMEAVGQLAGGVAHDFNNMLQVISGYTALVLDSLSETSSLREHLETVRSATLRSEELTRQLLAFARKQSINPTDLDLNETIEGMLKMLRRIIGENVELEWHPGEQLETVYMDPAQVDQILANLVVNARDAVESNGRVIISARNETVTEEFPARLPWSTDEQTGAQGAGRYVVVSVADNGVGIDPELRPRLFEPFFTTKEAGKGTGLGLPTIYGIARQNGGFVDVHSALGYGSTFEVYIPRSERHAKTAERAQLASEEPQGSEKVLVVDDEESLIHVTQVLLERLGYEVFVASSSARALEIVGQESQSISLLVTDVVMPEMTGIELSEKVREILPRVRCLYMSGYAPDMVDEQGRLSEPENLLQKPFSAEQLAEAVRTALDTHS